MNNNSVNVLSVPQVNIASREFKANPYPFYARLRAEAPVYRTLVNGKQPAWLITRYDDVFMVLKDEQRFVKNMRSAMNPEQLARQPWVPPMFKAFEQNLLSLDGADHTRLRGLIHKAFTPHFVEQMRGQVEVIANKLLDDMLSKAQQNRKIDLIRDYALPLPLTVISEILGISLQDRAKFQGWINGILSLDGTSGLNILRGVPNLLSISRYLRRIFKERRLSPQDDLITALVQTEEAGDQLSEDELTSMVFVLLIAGYETTVNLIGNGTLGLLENPDQIELLRQQPDLIKGGIEELLRYGSPVEQATERYAREDVELHGVTIPRGGLVLAVLASANRDSQQFENPDKLDLTRQNIKHLAFGQGAHYCVGAPLARLEGQIAISTLMARMPNLCLTTTSNKLRWRPGLTLHGLEALPVAA